MASQDPSTADTIEHMALAVPAGAADPWRGISPDLIRRYVDVLCIEHGLPAGELSVHRSSLATLDRWLMETRQRTLATATPQDIREYVEVSQSAMRTFFGFLLTVGCRDDDPTVSAKRESWEGSDGEPKARTGAPLR